MPELLLIKHYIVMKIKKKIEGFAKFSFFSFAMTAASIEMLRVVRTSFVRHLENTPTT